MRSHHESQPSNPSGEPGGFLISGIANTIAIINASNQSAMCGCVATAPYAVGSAARSGTSNTLFCKSYGHCSFACKDPFSIFGEQMQEPLAVADLDHEDPLGYFGDCGHLHCCFPSIVDI
jgi:hypothetical protein